MLTAKNNVVRPRKFKTAEDQDRWIKADNIADHLEEIARKADLVALALQGVMAHEDNDAAWPIQDAAFEIRDAIKAIAREVRS